MVAREDAPVKEVVLTGADADLTKIPAMWTSERDPSPYIASGMAIIKDPETGIRNMSIHRQQIQAPDRTGFLICPRHALRIYQMYQKRKQPMPAAMVIGAHPALYYAAAFTSAYGLDEIEVAGALIEDPIRLVKCETIDIEVPADAELVIEGEILPEGMTPEGPFGEASGTYAMEGSTEIFRVKAITHRREPIFYGMQCGAPVTDTQSITATCIETVVTDHIRNVEGGLDLKDVRCLGVAGLMAIVVKLRPRVAGQAKTALMAALSSPYLHPKLAIAVDDDIGQRLRHRARDEPDVPHRRQDHHRRHQAGGGAGHGRRSVRARHAQELRHRRPRRFPALSRREKTIANKPAPTGSRPDRTRSVDPEDSAGFLVRDTHLMFARALRTRLQPHKMTPGQWFVLRTLWQQEGLSQRELSRRVGTTEPTTVSALRLLERNDLVRRERNTQDRRTINIYLTDRAKRLREELLPLALEINDVATAGLTATELAQLRGILGKIRDNLAGEDA
jgi:DNA-binding MarR family transcriptional regulator